MRKMVLTARLCADAEKRVSQKTGSTYLYMRLASNEYNDEKDENGKPKTMWLTGMCNDSNKFGLLPFLTKGKLIWVEGRYSQKLFTRNDGTCDISNEIRITDMDFIGDGERKENAGTANPQATPTTQTHMEAPKPTTADLNVPQQLVNTDDDDDLPF